MEESEETYIAAFLGGLFIGAIMVVPLVTWGILDRIVKGVIDHKRGF